MTLDTSMIWRCMKPFEIQGESMKFNVFQKIFLCATIFALGGALLAVGCKPSGGGKGKKIFLNMGTSPEGGLFKPIGDSLSAVINENPGENNWKATSKISKGSQENIRLLDTGEYQLGVSNAAITYFAVNGEGTWDKKYNARAIVTLAPNVAMFVTKADSGIKTIADLKGKRVVCGPDGAGFEMFIEPILNAHGISMKDFDKKNNNPPGSVEMLTDGQVDAAFLGGGVPHPTIQTACTNMDLHFIPFDEAAKKKLCEEYPFFWEVTIPKDAYDDLKGDFQGLNVGSIHIITSEDQPEDVVYQITKTLWENREKISHPVPKKFMTEKNVARDTGTPFHPGAIKFYKEIGVWPESGE